jgi:hypothetical protein
VALRFAEVILTSEKLMRNVVPPLTVIHAELEGMDLGCPAWFAFHPQAHQQGRDWRLPLNGKFQLSRKTVRRKEEGTCETTHHDFEINASSPFGVLALVGH